MADDVGRVFLDHPGFRVDRLREIVFGARVPVYVFIDPMLDDPLADFLAKPSARPYAPHRVVLKHWGIESARQPYFVRLTGPLDDLLDTSSALAELQNVMPTQARSMCGWFASDQSPRVIEQNLQALMSHRLADGRRWFFRFFDPRVQRHWQRIMGDFQRFSGLHGWWYLDDEGTVSERLGDPQGGVLSLSNVQRSAFDRVAALNTALEQWREIDPGMSQKAYAQLDIAMQRAVEMGLSLDAEADVVAFALHRCMVHPRIELHPEVAQWIAHAAGKSVSYADAAAEADPALWAKIQSGQWEYTKEIHHG